MESAPLTLAHDHARAASLATQSSDTTVAINEHALAAGEFAKAASGTASAEALRTLRLLEQHHQRLSELLRYPSENPVVNPPSEAEVQVTTEKPLSTSVPVAELRASKSDLGPRASSPPRNPTGLAPRRLPPRDLSSSIASNLASARGIRGKNTRPPPLSPSLSTQQAPGSLETHRRRNLPNSIPEHAAPSWVPPSSSRKAEPKTGTSRTSVAAEPAAPAPAASDEGFSKFYSAFENILHRLSAPLAFAGLPLAAEEDPKSSESQPTSPKKAHIKTERQGSDPDLTKYISRAALRASARDGHAGNDSFYVVPTAGGTLSYAHILSFAEKEKRRMAASMHGENPDLFTNPDDEDDFVDARETLVPASPKYARGGSSRGKKMSERQLENKIEELGIENKSLKDCVDKLARRLQAFELSAQQSSMALNESMRLMREKSPARDRERLSPVRDRPSRMREDSGGTGVEAVSGDEALRRRVQELEDHVRLGGKEIERLGRENEKLKSVVARYRERWEKLKEGAKTRREATGTGTTSTGMKDAKEAQASSNGLARKDSDPGAGRFVAG